jgi:hypothetical protein
MVPKSGSRLPKTQISLSDAELAELIGTALRDELGASRRAAKTIIAWTGVSDRTARAWLNGRSSPSSLHLLAMAAHCKPVMATMLRLTGHEHVAIGIDLQAVEAGLEQTLAAVRSLSSRSS